jgi:hypothetical protein
VRNRDVQLAMMLIGQVFLYIITALPFASNALYLTLTQNDPTSSKSAYRIAAEAFSQTLTSSFGIYVFNGVRNLYYKYTSTLSYILILVIFLCLYINCTEFSS